MKKINTRAVCTFLAAFGTSIGIGLPKLDPANYWLGLVGELAMAAGLGCGALLAFFDKIFPPVPADSTKSSEPVA
jgi:hypothetical protein